MSKKISKCFEDMTEKDVERMIDSKSGIVRIPNSKNYYHNGRLIKVEFKNVFERMWYWITLPVFVR